MTSPICRPNADIAFGARVLSARRCRIAPRRSSRRFHTTIADWKSKSFQISNEGEWQWVH